MLIKDLVWDSNFFKKRIASVLIEQNDRYKIEDLLSTLRLQSYDLVYLFLEEGQELGNCYKNNLVDKKILYSGEIRGGELSPYISDYNASPGLLYSLSRQAGEYSRFKRDPKFSQDMFFRFYDTWIENSVKRDIADVVFVYKIADEIKGLITAKAIGGKMVIGLLAVTNGCRGLGVGTALIKHLKAYSIAIGINQLEVATQLDNIQACKFYEKNAMTQASITSIYHFWLNDINKTII